MNDYEGWRAVVGFPGYGVSDRGRVRLGSKILKPFEDRSGYLLVYLGKTARIATLVCEAWHGPRPKGQVVRHLNGDNQDNRSKNLAWGSQRDNAEDCSRVGYETMKEAEDRRNRIKRWVRR